MSYDQKIQSARKVIDEHNDNAENQIDFEQFTKKLIDMGGSSEESLRSVSWEDLQDCGLPKILARSVTHLFRTNPDSGSGKSTYISEKKASSLSFKELVERYNPKDVKNPVGKRLKDISDGKKFVVFDNDNKVIIDETVKLLEDITNGLPEVSTAFVNNRPLPIYSIGERPDFYVEENPLYPNRPLRSNEVCDQTGRSWSGIEMEIRQLLYIAITASRELDVSKVSEASDIMDKVMTKDCTLDTLRSRYPHASQMYDELEKMGQLPVMKIKLGGGSSSNGSNNPFGKNFTC